MEHIRALGHMARVRRLIQFTNSKEHLKGGISVADTFQKCSNIVEETFGQSEKVFQHEDSEQRSNKVTKEWMKFIRAFETIQALPSKYDRVEKDKQVAAYEPKKKGEKKKTKEQLNNF